MTDEYIRARLGYLEQALMSLAGAQHRGGLARVLAEQYVANYEDDFNPVSMLTFNRILENS